MGPLNQTGMAASVALGIGLALACAAALLAGWPQRPPVQAWWLALAVWVIGGALALRGGPASWPRLPRGLRLPLGLIALWAAWLAMSHARSVGINFILSVFCAWCGWPTSRPTSADVRFGKRKLAPGISPGKSWEGVYSGMVGVFVLTLCGARWSRAGSRQPEPVRPAVDQWGLLGGLAAAGLPDRHERGRRSDGIAGQARCRRQGQPAAAGPRRRARPRRCAAAGVPAGAGAAAGVKARP
jgi:phosphatidate cytidylyltransferase